MKSELEVAERVVGWLEEWGWDVYQEVQAFQGGPVADIVAKQGRVVQVIETKTCFNLRLLEQAWKWTSYANYVYIATPVGRGVTVGRLDACFRNRLLESIGGVGFLRVGDDDVCERVPARFNRRVSSLLRDGLRPEHKTAARAGAKGGGYWTAYRSTCRELEVFALRNPGCSLKEALGQIKHHYSTPSSARGCLGRLLELGKVHGVRAEREGGSWALYATTGKPTSRDQARRATDAVGAVEFGEAIEEEDL